MCIEINFFLQKARQFEGVLCHLLLLVTFKKQWCLNVIEAWLLSELSMTLCSCGSCNVRWWSGLDIQGNSKSQSGLDRDAWTCPGSNRLVVF